MKRILTLAAPAALAFLLPAAAQAAPPIAVSGGVGTTGGIVELQTRLTRHVQLRGGYNYLSFSHGETYDGIPYDGDVKFSTGGAFIDFHPFGGSFLVTGGAYFGPKSVDLHAQPDQNVEIGSQTFTPAETGALDGKAKLNDTAPFLGLGWDTTFQGGGHLGFKFVAGAMYTGQPDVTLKATGGTLSNDPNFQQQVMQEQQKLQGDVDNFKVYPVIQAGLTVRF